MRMDLIDAGASSLPGSFTHSQTLCPLHLLSSIVLHYSGSPSLFRLCTTTRATLWTQKPPCSLLRLPLSCFFFFFTHFLFLACHTTLRNKHSFSCFFCVFSCEIIFFLSFVRALSGTLMKGEVCVCMMGQLWLSCCRVFLWHVCAEHADAN